MEDTNKFNLTNVVLYAKGWYKKTDDIWNDLKQILILDDYTPFTKNDVYQIILNNVEKINGQRWTSTSALLNGIHPDNCWKINYNETTNYKLEEAVIHYVISNLRFIDNKKWSPKMPRVTKYPKNDNISINDLYRHFCNN